VGLAESEVEPSHRPVVLVRGAGRTLAWSVDRVIDARELVLQDSSQMLRRAAGVAGTAFRSDGRVLFVLDPLSLDEVHRTTVAEGAAKLLRQRAQARRTRILVIDDAISVRKALSQLLQDAGFDVHAARDGFDALQWLEAERCDLVLTDLEMPNLNGLDFTRLMRQRPDSTQVPVVMITSRSTQKHRDAAQQAGVNLYLTKPYTDDDLLGHVRRLLKG
jgi:chemosensory pili system protein ChpA (sensor histidine kinase/response regulator)